MLRRLTLVLIALAVPASAAAEIPDRPTCGTHLHQDRITSIQPVFFGDAPRGGLELRDAFGEAPNIVTSERFALKWGSSLTVSEGTAQDLLAMMEAARDAQVVGTGLPDPTGWDNTFFNVYIGDSGPEVPSADGAGGYYSWDGDDFPFIVLGADTATNESWAHTVTSHEFFHAVQGATFNYY